MTELCRLPVKDKEGRLTLVLTDTHFMMELDPATRAKMEAGFAKGQAGVAKVPGVLGYVLEKVMKVTGKIVPQIFEPHPLSEVELTLKGDHLAVALPGMRQASNPEVDPVAAADFVARFEAAKAALKQ